MPFFFAVSAFAEISVKTVSPVSVPVEQDCPLSGEVDAGYASNYTCRGIVASHSLTEGDGIIPASVDLNYKLDDCNSVVGAASCTFLISGHHMAGERDFSFHNETDFLFGWKNRDGLLKNLSTTLGWNGLPGNWFAGVTMSYAFQGMTGWWFRPHVGHQAAICSDIDFVLSAGMSATSSYFDNKSLFMSNGSQAWWLKAELPVKLGAKNLSLVPFVSFNWAGEGALKANRGSDRGDKPYKNFGVVAGAGLVYSF